MAASQIRSHSSPQQAQAPRPPRKQPYHDGISRSAQHYDLFEMIKKPYTPRDLRPPEPPLKKKSPRQKMQTLESKLEKKVEYKFAKAHAPSQRYGLLATLIRALFTLFVLPFYFLFFKGPKQLFQLVKLFHTRVKTLFCQCCKKIFLPVQAVFFVVAKPIIRLKQKATRKLSLLKHQTQQFFSKLNSQLIGVTTYLKFQLLIDSKRLILSWGTSLYQKLEQFSKSCQILLKKSLHLSLFQLQSFYCYITRDLQLAFKKKIQSLKNSFDQMTKSSSQRILEINKHLAKRLKELVSYPYASIQYRAKRGGQWLKTQQVRIATKLSLIKNVLVSRLINPLKKLSHQMSTSFNGYKVKLLLFVKKLAHPLYLSFSNFLKKSRTSLANRFQLFKRKNSTISTNLASIRKLSARFKAWRPLTKRTAQKFVVKVQAQSKKIKPIFYPKLNQLFLSLKQGAALIVGWLAAVLIMILRPFYLTFNCVKFYYLAIVATFNHLMWQYRLIAIWLRVLARYGMRSVHRKLKLNLYLPQE